MIPLFGRSGTITPCAIVFQSSPCEQFHSLLRLPPAADQKKRCNAQEGLRENNLPNVAHLNKTPGEYACCGLFMFFPAAGSLYGLWLPGTWSVELWKQTFYIEYPALNWKFMYLPLQSRGCLLVLTMQCHR